MKKILIIIILLVLALAAVIFYLFSKNSQGFKADSELQQLIEEQNSNNFSNSNNTKVMFKISSVFANNGSLPVKYSCDGENINPPLVFSGVPEEAQSLVLILDDPDASSGDWVHWLVYNINPRTTEIAENSVPDGASLGLNSSGEASYDSPCPPNGTHHYHFKLYALDNKLSLPASAEKIDLLEAIDGHILAKAELIGTYSR